jgi:recombination protein RecT
MKTTGEEPKGNGATEPALAPKKQMNIAEWLQSKQASFAMILPRHMTAERFMKITLSAVISNPALGKADPISMMDAVRKCAQYGLEPDGRHAALVPFRNGGKSRDGKDVFDVVFMPMVHGLIKLVKQTGEVSVIAAREVYANDLFEYQYDFETSYKHVPSEGDRGDLRGVYAYYVLKDGGRDFVYMSVADAKAWGKRYAKSFEKADSLWQTDIRSAALKTVMRKLLHFAPLSCEIPEDADEMRNVTPPANITSLPEMTFDLLPEKTSEEPKP